VKVGDLVETTVIGPEGSVGELGVLLSETWEGDCWEVYFNGVRCIYSKTHLEVVNESR
jgi:hypothetical protein